MSSFVLRDVEVSGARCDVLVRDGVVARLANNLAAERGVEEISGAGGALLPGLHDHHLHLLALAAERGSVRCGPPDIADAAAFGNALRRASADLPPGGWLRGTGYHESVAGDLDAAVLDRLVAEHPVRIQHRSGALWMLNTAALRLVEPCLDSSPDVERDGSGKPNGRLWRYDARLRSTVPPMGPDLSVVGRSLAAFGITGVTDATPGLTSEAVALLRGGLPQRMRLLGAPGGTAEAGPWKIHLRDHDLPDPDALAEEIAAAHVSGRSVAVHCVTAASLLLTLAALEEAGPSRRDRIEHASVVPREVYAWMRRLGVTVVTQPAFIMARGDDYLRDVDQQDRACLYPYASLLEAGIPTVASSDAPYGPLDPWAVMRAARDRQAPSGAVVLAHERVTTLTALEGYLTPLEDPSGRPRKVRPQAEADLLLLEGSLDECLADPDSGRVRRVWRAGRLIHAAE